MGTDVTGWQPATRRIERVHTTRGDFAADEFILCGGAWSSSIARDLGLRLPMQAGKGYSLTLAQPRQLPQICAILTEARVAVTPMGGTLRFGGTMEIAGLNEDINPRRVRGIIKSVPPYYPDFTPDDFREAPALARAAPVFAGRLALRRTVRGLRQPLRGHGPRHDGPEPGPDHRRTGGANPRRRTALDRHWLA